MTEQFIIPLLMDTLTDIVFYIKNRAFLRDNSFINCILILTQKEAGLDKILEFMQAEADKMIGQQ